MAMQLVPVAETLGIICPRCATQLEDRIGPFWCPGCQRDVWMLELAPWLPLLMRAVRDND
jgi:hypothetical protein